MSREVKISEEKWEELQRTRTNAEIVKEFGKNIIVTAGACILSYFCFNKACDSFEKIEGEIDIPNKRGYFKGE